MSRVLEAEEMGARPSPSPALPTSAGVNGSGRFRFRGMARLGVSFGVSFDIGFCFLFHFFVFPNGRIGMDSESLLETLLLSSPLGLSDLDSDSDSESDEVSPIVSMSESSELPSPPDLACIWAAA